MAAFTDSAVPASLLNSFIAELLKQPDKDSLTASTDQIFHCFSAWRERRGACTLEAARLQAMPVRSPAHPSVRRM